MSSSKYLKYSVSVIVLALAIGAGSAWYANSKIDKEPSRAYPESIVQAANDLVSMGTGNAFVDELWFTKTDLHALSFVIIENGEKRVILQNDSSKLFFELTSPKFMREEGYKTYAENTDLCPLVGTTRVPNILVLASDRNIYVFDQMYGCFPYHEDYIRELDVATKLAEYGVLPEFSEQ